MSLIIDAERALFRNWRTVLLYIALCAVIVGLYRVAINELNQILAGGAVLTQQQLDDIKPKPSWYLSGNLAADIALACLISVLQACSYARLGSDIDKPLWKCKSDQEAIARYAVIWVMLNLLYFALLQIKDTLGIRGFESYSGVMDLFALIWNLLYVQIGVCLMHHGGLKDLKWSEALMPMFHFLPRTLLVAGLGFLQLVLFQSLVLGIPEAMREVPWVIALVNVPLIYLECLSVAIMWIACAEYRQIAAEQSNEDDFDF